MPRFPASNHLKQSEKEKNMKKLLQFILDRGRERSTWLGIVSLATALGVVVTPAQSDAIIAAGIAIAGLLAVFTKDTSAKP
jgi:hypothetical protein